MHLPQRANGRTIWPSHVGGKVAFYIWHITCHWRLVIQRTHYVIFTAWRIIPWRITTVRGRFSQVRRLRHGITLRGKHRTAFKRRVTLMSPSDVISGQASHRGGARLDLIFRLTVGAVVLHVTVTYVCVVVWHTHTAGQIERWSWWSVTHGVLSEYRRWSCKVNKVIETVLLLVITYVKPTKINIYPIASDLSFCLSITYIPKSLSLSRTHTHAHSLSLALSLSLSLHPLSLSLFLSLVTSLFLLMFSL